MKEIQVNDEEGDDRRGSPERKAPNSQYERGKYQKPQPAANKGALFFAPRHKSSGVDAKGPVTERAEHEIDPTATNNRRSFGQLWSQAKKPVQGGMVAEHTGLLSNLTGDYPTNTPAGEGVATGAVLLGRTGNTDMDSGYRKKFEGAFQDMLSKAAASGSKPESSPAPLVRDEGAQKVKLNTPEVSTPSQEGVNPRQQSMLAFLNVGQPQAGSGDKTKDTGNNIFSLRRKP